MIYQIISAFENKPYSVHVQSLYSSVVPFWILRCLQENCFLKMKDMIIMLTWTIPARMSKKAPLLSGFCTLSLYNINLSLMIGLDYCLSHHRWPKLNIWLSARPCPQGVLAFQVRRPWDEFDHRRCCLTFKNNIRICMGEKNCFCSLWMWSHQVMVMIILLSKINLLVFQRTS